MRTVILFALLVSAGVAASAEKLVYTVGYSDRSVTGPDSWALLNPAPKDAKLLRDYGGSKAFMATDVTTGDRSAAEGAMRLRPSFAAVCDAEGLHFRFTDPGENAEKGSYEFYLAPGEGRPYYCVLAYPDGRPISVVNTLYDSPGHRRIDARDSSCVRCLSVRGASGLVTYVSFAWGTWADRIPTDGFRWDFEVVRWGASGSAAWNGLRSIHGRSTWGELSFVLPDRARAAILRRQLARAKTEYLSEKTATKTKTGVLDHWKDAELGDPAFYRTRLAAIEQELDGLAEAVRDGLSNAEVVALAERAIPRWRDLPFTVSRLRADYLREQVAKRAESDSPASVTPPPPFRKKLIANSWDLEVFSPADVLSNRAAFAKLPIDGAVFFANGPRLPNGKPIQVDSPLNAEVIWPESAFAGVKATFRELMKLPNLKHSFISFKLGAGTRGRRALTDDAAWSRFAKNVATLVATARDGGLKGLCADTEDYLNKKQFERVEGDPDYETCVRLVRRRGREFARALWGAYPDATLFSYWMFSLSRRYAYASDPQADIRRAGDLWPAFLDGLLDELPPGGLIVDGDETSYSYEAFTTDRMSYAEGAARNRALVAIVSPENRRKFRGQVSFGAALYLDQFTNTTKSQYYSGPLSGSRLLHFDENLSAARRASDEYVWLWAEKSAWIDWKVHGKPARETKLNPHRSWDVALPGVYDSMRAAFDEPGFLADFPALRGTGSYTNLVRTGRVKATKKMADGATAAWLTVRRGQRFVFELTASGEKPGAEICFFKGNERLWHVSSVKMSGAGEHRRLVRVPFAADRIWFRVYTGGDAKSAAEFSNVGVYSLPE